MRRPTIAIVIAALVIVAIIAFVAGQNYSSWPPAGGGTATGPAAGGTATTPAAGGTATGAAAGPVSATAWSSSDKSPDIKLSNGNLTATQSGAKTTWSSVRGTTSKTTGKWYFRLTVDVVDSDFGWIGGISDSTAPLVGYIGFDAHGAGFQTSANFWQSGVNNIQAWDQLGAGSVVDIAVDLDARKIWAKIEGTESWNHSPDNSPTAGTGGLDITPIKGAVFPAWSGYNGSAADQATIDETTVLPDPALKAFTNWGG